MPARLYKMGIRESSDCTSCSRDLFHLLWRYPKLHLYWTVVITTINKVFQVNVPVDPKPCILGILHDLPIKDNPKQALFETRKLILRCWKATELPTLKQWIAQAGVTLCLEKYIFQYCCCPGKFDILWFSWLNTTGLSPVDLILDRFLP